MVYELMMGKAALKREEVLFHMDSVVHRCSKRQQQMNIWKNTGKIECTDTIFLPVLFLAKGRKIEHLKIRCWTVLFPEFQRYDSFDSLINADMRKTHFDFER